jgi:hypothetical protein
MKVVCINRSDNKYMIHHYFTIGKTYEYFLEDKYYLISNDKGRFKSFQDWQFRESFKCIQEERDKKINKILGI